MEKKAWNNQNSGFTVVELMAVVVIIVILLALSMVGVGRYRGMLKLTELDNAAREIYMAAENRAVLLSGARRLETQVGQAAGLSMQTGRAGDGGAERLRYVSRAQVEQNGELLTAGSIDPALMDGDFYIVYDLASGSVTDVFFTEGSMTELLDQDWFDNFRSEWPKSRSARLDEKLMVGYYNGEAAGGREENTEEAQIFVDITNGEELTVTVTYYLPDGSMGMGSDVELKVELGTIDLTHAKYNQWKTALVPTGDGGYSQTWVLDSLTKTDRSGSRLAFSALGSGIDPGDDFTVTAVVSSKSGSFEEDTGSDTDNSLFQYKENAGDTAYIENLRHLQNLNDSFSGAVDKTRAVQTADIRCVVSGDDGTEEPYDFLPIENKDIVSYDGDGNEITGLYVSGEKSEHGGLFSKIESAEMSLSGIRLVNASVSANGGDAGALVGFLEGMARISDCQVYWERNTDLPDIKTVLLNEGNSAEPYNDQINGRNAGGLVGYAKSNCEITDSLAATLVRGTACAGGLIGVCETAATVSGSYADCYLNGGTKAAGLIGEVGGYMGSAALTDCYAAGFITGGTTTAGLCAGAGTTTAENVYSVVNGASHPLTEYPEKDTYYNTHFLGGDTVTDSNWNTVTGKSFDVMTDDAFAAVMGEGVFEKKTISESHAYDLQVDLGAYEYPGLVGLPHYGDWNTKFREVSLVYFEEYDHNTVGISGGSADNLRDDLTIRSDGYGVAFLANDRPAADPEVTYKYFDPQTGELISVTSSSYTIKTTALTENGETSTVYVIPLPDDLVNSGAARENFYGYLRFELTLVSGRSIGEFFFNPHFAETVRRSENLQTGMGEETVTAGQAEAEAAELVKSMGNVRIRTPRHLYDLSRFAEYYNKGYSFSQTMELDYSAYTGYNNMLCTRLPYVQTPIGTADQPFRGAYNGYCNLIKNVAPETARRRYVGLFGCSEGRLQNIVYEMNPDNPLSISMGGGSNAGYNYVGALAGRSSGAVQNCAVYGVNIQGAFSSVTVYVGGLVGWNSGDILNCEAECAQISVNCLYYVSVYTGGLVGQNDSGGSVSSSYAVGRIKAGLDDNVRSVNLCGLTGWNSGRLAHSYAAMDLKADKENANIYGVCNVTNGAQTGNAYLGNGSFSYRDVAYAAGYAQENANACTYQQLVDQTGANQAQSSPQKTAAEPEEQYPYPAVVTDRTGRLIHYGRWPVLVPLADMGVLYWEKIVDAADGSSNPAYYFSILAVDTDQKTITKQSTLPTDHDDSRVVVEYGYGYYSSKEKAEQRPVTFEAENIGYTEYVGNSLFHQKLYGSKDYKYRLRYKNLHQQIADGEVHNADKLNHDLYLSNYSNGVPDNIQSQFNSDQANSDKRSENIEKAAAAGLEGLLPNYTFTCWNSYQVKARKGGGYLETVKNATSGLYLFNGSDYDNVDPNGGRFILKQGGLTVRFRVNPQFADSMAVVTGENGYQLNNYELTNNAKSDELGTLNNPFQVRCGLQLQHINWYDTCFTDVTFGQGSYTDVKRFPYLTNSSTGGKYYWAQTHDIDWIAEGNAYTEDGKTNPGKFMGIAQIRVNGNSLQGWFGGSYDGQHYTIKNLNIGKNNNYDPNCMGMFGAVQNATLENIVLFSETGENIVTVSGRASDTGDSGAWYAGGVLAGVALNSTISNCAVAGYTVRDETKVARYNQQKYQGNRYYTMGGAIGGLVGMTDQKLTGCTAVATIEIACDHSLKGQNSPIRVGGLVGSTTAGVENCYTGGTIDVSGASSAALYAGRLIGGVGIGPLNNDTETNTRTVAISNCYSYLTLPGKRGVVADTYNIGGSGRTTNAPAGTVTLTNNYYLSGTADNVNGQRAVTYRQLADLEPIGGQSIYDLLSGYSQVTSSADGLEAYSRYSFVPKNQIDLQGMDYPFPTVLTMDGCHVHYGAWKLNGIYFVNGSRPVGLDMFTRDSTDTNADGRQLELRVVGAETPQANQWRVDPVKDGDITIVDGSVSNNVLTVTAYQAVEGCVTLNVWYGDLLDPLPVTVYVSARVELRPAGRTAIFPNDSVTWPLSVYGYQPGSQQDVLFSDGALHMDGIAEEPVKAEVSEENGTTSITLTRSGEETTSRDISLSAPYAYTRNGYTVDSSYAVSVELLELPLAWDEAGKAWVIDFDGMFGEDDALNGVTGDAAVEGNAVKLADSGTVPDELTITLTMGGVQHRVTVTRAQLDAARGA